MPPTATEERVVADAAAFARAVVAPHAAQWEREQRQPREALRAAGDAGLCGLLVPTARGGRGLRAAAAARVFEELAAADMAFAFALVVHNNLAATICRHGDEATIASELPTMLTGERLGAFLLTEPGVGSDAAAITTTARRDGGRWVLDGAKAWITNAATANLLSVYAQTDPTAGPRGIACFLVDAERPGVERLPAYAMLGCHATATGGFVFTGCAVDDDRMLIPPGQAFRSALAGIDLARVLVAAMSTGMLREGLAVAVRATRTRRVFGRPVAELQGPQWMLADAATDLAAARGLVQAATEALDTGADGTVAAAHAKKFATRAAMTHLTACMQLLGAAGFSHDHPLARHLAGAKMAQYLDGTTEIQNVVIARHLLG